MRSVGVELRSCSEAVRWMIVSINEMAGQRMPVLKSTSERGKDRGREMSERAGKQRESKWASNGG